MSGDRVAVMADISSFEGYVAVRSVGLQRFAYLVCGDLEDARELVQEALTGLYRHWERVVPRGDPEAYVRRSIVNAHISDWRRHGRERVASDPAVLDTAAVGGLAQEVVDADLVGQLFATLPPRHRAVLVMRFYERRSFADIAEACGCAEATARSLAHRALAALRAQLPSGSQDD